MVSMVVAVNPPQLPLHLCSSEQQAFSTCKSSRPVHASSPCMVDFHVNWYLLETEEKSEGGESTVSPCTRHTEEDTQLIPIDVLLGREQQPVSALGWEGRNGKQEGREQT